MTFSASVQAELSSQAQNLVGIYDATYGASGPYCCPAALANVLEHLGLLTDARILRGEQP